MINVVPRGPLIYKGGGHNLFVAVLEKGLNHEAKVGR